MAVGTNEPKVTFLVVIGVSVYVIHFQRDGLFKPSGATAVLASVRSSTKKVSSACSLSCTFFQSRASVGDVTPRLNTGTTKLVESAVSFATDLGSAFAFRHRAGFSSSFPISVMARGT